MDLTSFFQTAPVHPDVIEQSLWMIIALPLLGAFICGVFGRMMGRANVHLVACSAVAGSFVLSVLAFWATSHTVSRGVPISVPNTFGGDAAALRHLAGPGHVVHRGQLPGELRLAGGPPVRHPAAGDHRRGLPHPPVLHQLHGARRGVLALLRVPEPVRRDDADAGDGRQPGAALRGLGGRGHGQLPAHRLLVHGPGQGVGGAQGLHHQPHR